MLSKINSLPNRRELIEADLSWWTHFFYPAIEAYCSGDDEKFYDIYGRYKEVCGYEEKGNC